MAAWLCILPSAQAPAGLWLERWSPPGWELGLCILPSTQAPAGLRGVGVSLVAGSGRLAVSSLPHLPVVPPSQGWARTQAFTVAQSASSSHLV